MLKNIQTFLCCLLVATCTAFSAATVPTVNTIADLRTLNAGAYPTVQVLGYSTIGDGGAGFVQWIPTSTATPDSCTVFRPSSNPARGRWVRLTNGTISMEQCGGIAPSLVTISGRVEHSVTLFQMTLLTLSGGNIAVNASLSDYYYITLTGNATLSNPTNSVAGRHFTLRVRQDATGSRTLAYGANYRFPGATAPTLTTTAGATDYLSFVYHETDAKWDYVGNAFNYVP